LSALNPQPFQPSAQAAKPGVLFIVDDEPLVTVSLEAFLSLNTDYELYTFNEPALALEALNTITPDVVVSDFVMPVMDGVTFLSEVRLRLPEVTCILLTGYADKENAIASINKVGLYRYMEKPWDNQELLLTLHNGLERARLVTDLRYSNQQLQQAHSELQGYNQKLEALVEERTQDLRQTYQKLHSIVQHATDGIVTVNRQGKLASYNPAVAFWLHQFRRKQQAMAAHPALTEATLGTEQNSFLELPFDQLFRLGQGLAFTQLVNDLKQEVSFEAHLGSRALEVNMAPILEGEGGYVLMLRDVTQRKETERLREDFVSTLTHDLRTPLLAAIQTFGFFTDGTLGPLAERQLQMLGMLHESHKDLLGLVNTLLEVYKYEANRQTLVLDGLDMSRLVGQVMQELGSLATAKNLKLDLCLPPASSASPDEPLALSVYADRQELRRVLVNLLGNALHYTPKQGQVQVRLLPLPVNSAIKKGGSKSGAASEAWLRLEVVDNGPGIPATDVTQLFQRFSQGTSRKRNSGTGLGLYLSRQIIEAHGGRIGVNSVEGQGSCFWIEMPLLGKQAALQPVV
jgi:signal transduction histidine kinase